MDGHNPGLSQDQYVDVDNIDYYQQQQEFNDLKLQQQLAKQHYSSPIEAPQQFSTDPSVLGPDLVAYDEGDEGNNYATFQKLSQVYVPEYTEPLVGELRSTRDLQDEYANADPVYVVKTAALYPRYSNYRKIRGDGNCAWRAIAYGYFELLLRNGNQELIIGEHARLVSLNNLLNAAGFAQFIWEDFADETFKLLDQMKVSPMIDFPNDTTEVERIFNSDVSDSIIAYFKFLTSAWMRTRSEVYQNYLETTVEDYCSNCIEPFGIELDHVGVKALIDCLLNPAGLRVEISYLDRSVGTEVNVHHFENNDCSAGLDRQRPSLSLLYRPGHYDIIYKAGDIPGVMPAQQSLTSAHIVPASPVQVSFMPQLPEQYFSDTPLNYFLSSGGVIHPERRIEDKDKFRASLFQYPPFQPSPLPFQTSIFRNSAYNPSHYQSENFQPELYQPEVSTQREVHGNRRR